MRTTIIDIGEYSLLNDEKKRTLEVTHTEGGANLPSVIGACFQGYLGHKVNETISIDGIDYMVVEVGKVVYETHPNGYLDSSMNIFVRRINESTKEFVFSTEGIYTVEDIDPRFIDVRGTDARSGSGTVFSLELPSMSFGEYAVKKGEAFVVNMTISTIGKEKEDE